MNAAKATAIKAAGSFDTLATIWSRNSTNLILPGQTRLVFIANQTTCSGPRSALNGPPSSFPATQRPSRLSGPSGTQAPNVPCPRRLWPELRREPWSRQAGQGKPRARLVHCRRPIVVEKLPVVGIHAYLRRSPWLSVVHQGDADSLVWGIVALMRGRLLRRSLRSSLLSAGGTLEMAEFAHNSATFGDLAGAVVRSKLADKIGFWQSSCGVFCQHGCTALLDG